MSDQRQPLWHITAIAALVLYIEMLLIRWIGTEIRVFAYLQNATLVAAFLGLGLGCTRASQPPRFLAAVIALLGIGLVIRDPFDSGIAEVITQGLVAFEDSVVWSQSLPELSQVSRAWIRVGSVSFSLLASMFLLLAVANTMFPLGQLLGRMLAASPRPIAAYSADIFGSLLGIAVFDLLTLAWTPPWIWLALASGALLVTVLRNEQSQRRKLACTILLLVVPWLGVGNQASVWSPYQKLTLVQPKGADRKGAEMIEINGVWYQQMLNLDREYLRTHPDLYPPKQVALSHYVLPYRLLGKRKDVLIVGSGSGNDVAAAIAAGAEKIRAVEIDPVIVEWGRARHPNQPYTFDRVETIIGDGRAALRKTDRRFDLVWFGLLDSHTTPSAYTNVRLDHFVYTRESLEEAKRLLKPGGVVVLYFQAERTWIAQRLIGLAKETFKTQPLSMGVGSRPGLGHGGFLVIAGAPDAIGPVWEKVLASDEIRPMLVGTRWDTDVELTTDDWPYLYLQHRGIPDYHILMGVLSVLVMLLMSGRRGLRRSPDWIMLLLGAGFMLLETSAVSRAALLFGTTWTVNAYVVGSVLVMILFANLLASKLASDRVTWVVGCLAASLLALAAVPPTYFLYLPMVARILAGGLFLTLPVLFSGMLFVTQWASREHRDAAFGDNLLGALFGGVASLLSMLVGFSGLALLALAIYLGAALLIVRRAQA